MWDGKCVLFMNNYHMFNTDKFDLDDTSCHFKMVAFMKKFSSFESSKSDSK